MSVSQGSASGSKPSSSSSTPSHNGATKPADHAHTNHTSNHAHRPSRRQQLSAPLNLSITKLSPRRGPRTHSAKASTVGGGGETSFQQDVTSFPGGDSMLEVLTRLQGVNEQLNQQLEVSTCLTHSTNHVKCGMK